MQSQGDGSSSESDNSILSQRTAKFNSVMDSNESKGKRHFLIKEIPHIQQNGDYLNDLVVLTTVTSSFIDFTENWLLSISRLGGIHPKIYIIAEDQQTYDHFRATSLMSNINIISAPHFEANSSLLFDTNEYKNFVNKRPKYILDILDSGHDVLFCDVDIVWFHRPYRYLIDSDVDIYFLQDQGPPDETVLCAGFALYRATNATKQFMKRWIDEINSFKEPRPDQIVLNRLLIKNKLLIEKPVPKVKFEVLDPDHFVSGRFYFNESWRKANPHVKPVVLHNNWIIGRDVKVERFKQIGKWFLWLEKIFMWQQKWHCYSQYFLCIHNTDRP